MGGGLEGVLTAHKDEGRDLDPRKLPGDVVAEEGPEQLNGGPEVKARIPTDPRLPLPWVPFGPPAGEACRVDEGPKKLGVFPLCGRDPSLDLGPEKEVWTGNRRGEHQARHPLRVPEGAGQGDLRPIGDPGEVRPLDPRTSRRPTRSSAWSSRA